MGRDFIDTSTDNDQDQDFTPVTGTDLGSSKRGVDVNLGASAAPVPNTTGSTDHENGSVGTTPANIPAAAGNIITDFYIENTHATQNMLFSLDGGTTYKTVLPADAYGVEPKGSLTQILIKGSGASTTYEIMLNRVA